MAEGKIKKRIFVAIPISPELQKEIFKWEEKYSKLPVRWLKGKNLHITLIPPWRSGDIESVIKKLETVKGSPFKIEFDKVSYGPDPKRPRLIWASGKAPNELIHLKEELEKIFPEHKSEYKNWIAHTTIARFEPETFPSFPVKKLNKEVIWRDDVNSFTLMESRPSPAGADYEILKECKFASAPTFGRGN